jgi:hypothetical protein
LIFPDRALPRPGAPRELIVDDHDRLRALIVVVGEEAASTRRAPTVSKNPGVTAGGPPSAQASRPRPAA